MVAIVKDKGVVEGRKMRVAPIGTHGSAEQSDKEGWRTACVLAALAEHDEQTVMR
jgi:hypothetical protein